MLLLVMVARMTTIEMVSAMKTEQNLMIINYYHTYLPLQIGRPHREQMDSPDQGGTEVFAVNRLLRVMKAATVSTLCTGMVHCGEWRKSIGRRKRHRLSVELTSLRLARPSDRD